MSHRALFKSVHQLKCDCVFLSIFLCPSLHLYNPSVDFIDTQKIYGVFHGLLSLGETRVQTTNCLSLVIMAKVCSSLSA